MHVDPIDAALVHPAYPPSVHSGRMRAHARRAVRGRLAVGRPRLLLPDATKLHSVPALPSHCMRRPEQKELRARLVGGQREDGVMLGIVDGDAADHVYAEAGASSGGGSGAFAGISGTAGLGKTALACWLCHDTLVRSAYRDEAPDCPWLPMAALDCPWLPLIAHGCP